MPYVARDVGTLYTTAKNRLDQGRYKEAAILFDEVERQHPYSIWARRAQLMSAFSYYLARDYTQSIQSAQRFISVHPGNRDAAYAYYLVALGYYEQITDVTRDQKITRQALDALGELMRRYPNTRYASDARLKIDQVNDHLAGKEMEVGRFYEARGQWLAANMRFKRVIEQYQTTTHAPEALMRLTETYLNLACRSRRRRPPPCSAATIRQRLVCPCVQADEGPSLAGSAAGRTGPPIIPDGTPAPRRIRCRVIRAAPPACRATRSRPGFPAPPPAARPSARTAAPASRVSKAG